MLLHPLFSLHSTREMIQKSPRWLVPLDLEIASHKLMHLAHDHYVP